MWTSRPKLFFTALILSSTAASAAVPATPHAVGTGVVAAQPSAAETLDRWAGLYFDGQWAELQADVQAVLSQPMLFTPAPGGAGGCVFEDANGGRKSLDFSRQHYSVVFTTFAREPVTGEVIRFTVHDEPRPEPYSTSLPGVGSLCDIFLTDRQTSARRSSYLMERQKNPIFDKLPDLLKQLPLDAIQEALEMGPVDEEKRLYVGVSRVDLPFRRGSLKIADQVTVGSELEREFAPCFEGGVPKCDQEPAEGDKCWVRTLAASLAIRQARTSDCARGLTEWLAAKTCELASACRAGSDADQRRCLKLKIEAEYDGYVTRSSTCSVLDLRTNDLLVAIEGRFQAGIAGAAAKKPKADWSYDNVPRQRFSLGAATAVMLDTSGDERVKVDAGNLAADPLSGSLTLVLVNIHPVSFDSTTEEPEPAERWRLFAGATITPEAGLAVGVSYAPLRNLAIVLGYALLDVDAARAGDMVGEMPADAADPFADGTAGAIFLGLGFNL